LQAVPQNAKSYSDGATVPSRSKSWRVIGWCLPVLLGFVVFLIAFPIDRKIPFWPHWSLAEVFGAWFLFVTPPATVVAIVTYRRHARLGHISSTPKWLLLVAMTVAILLNLLLLFGLYAAATF